MMRNGNGGLKGVEKVGFLSTPSRNSSRRCVRLPTTTRCSSDCNDYAVLGLTPFASKADVKYAYKRLALKYHPDVIRGEQNFTAAGKHETFHVIKSAYQSLMQKFEEEEAMREMTDSYDEYDEWDEWMGFEGGMPAPFHSY